MIFGIMMEFLLAKADGVKFEPSLKCRKKNGRISIIDMDFQEAHIIDDVFKSGISMLTVWFLVKHYREV